METHPVDTPQQPAKQKNWFLRHKVLTAILVLAVLGIIGAAGNSNNAPTNSANTGTSKSATNSPSSTVSTPQIGQPADDGKLEFTINSSQCGVSQIEQPDDTSEVSTAGAPYCVLNLSVKNISNVGQTFDDSSQYLYDASGKQYSEDSSATIDANPVSSQFMEYPTVNPGVTLTGVVAFDIPSGTTPTYAMLHDSVASNGVKVNLQK